MDSPQAQEYIIDSEMLIASVEAIPLIWDTNHSHYKDRSKRRKCWIKICQSLFDDFDCKDETEKEFISRQIETKWRHIRDNYRREVRLNKLPGSKLKRRYVYSSQLEFLRPLMEGKVIERLQTDDSNNDYQEQDAAVEDDDSDEPVVQKKRARTARSRSSRNVELDEAMIPIEHVDSHKHDYAEESDDDAAFFRSLMPMLATLTPQQKMKFRIDIMQQLLKYQHSSASAVKFE